MNSIVMSKKTYATKAAALKAAGKDVSATGETHNLPSGRFCFIRAISVQEA